MQDGVLLMGGAPLGTLLYRRRHPHLVTMYSINVFVTFSLSQLAMLRYWWARARGPGRRRVRDPWDGVRPLRRDPDRHRVREVRPRRLGDGRRDRAGRRALLRDPAPLPPRRHPARSGSTPCSARCPRTPASRARPSTRRRPPPCSSSGGYSGLGVHSLLTIQRLFPGTSGTSSSCRWGSSTPPR